MKHYEALAFDASDKFCQCKDGEYCEASPYMKGFMAGYLAACEELTSEEATTQPLKHGGIWWAEWLLMRDEGEK